MHWRLAYEFEDFARQFLNDLYDARLAMHSARRLLFSRRCQRKVFDDDLAGGFYFCHKPLRCRHEV